MKRTINWQKVKLGDICTPQKGLTYKSQDYSNESDGQVFITLKCIAKGGGFNKNGIKHIKRGERSAILHSGDLIIANTDLTRAGDVIGAPLFIPMLNGENEYIFSMDISKLEVDNSKLDQGYLYQFLLTKKVRNYMRDISSGSTVLHLKVNLIDKLQIPLPGLKTQQKVSSILSSVDEAIQKTDQIIQKTELFKRGLMSKLLTKGIGHKKFKKAKIGEIPEVWNIEHISDIAKITTGVTPLRSRKDYYSGNIPWIKSNQVNFNRIKTSEETISLDAVKECRMKLIKHGAILIAMYGQGTTRGRCALLEVEATTNQAVASLEASNDVNNLYLYYYLQSNYEYLRSLGHGGNQLNLNTRIIGSIEVPVPSKSEQQQIVDILEGLDHKINQEQTKKTKLELLKKGLLQDIFSQKVTID